MKPAALALGVLLAGMIAAGLFWMVASVEGWKVAAGIWGFSIVAMALMVGTGLLIQWGLS